MELADRVVLVTGGANGIGRALCLRIARERPRGIVIADVDLDAAKLVAESVGGLAVECDVSCEASVQSAVEQTRQRFGPVDVLVSNAGITIKGGFDTPDDQWARLWQTNLMSHVYFARAVVPGMIERGAGAFVITASAAGLLTEIGSAAYSVTKHGAVAFAEWLSVNYRKSGLRVVCLCPAGVSTNFLDDNDPVHQFLHYRSVTPDHVADCVVEAVQAERFLVLPHPEVGEFFQFKTQDYDKWLHNFAHVNSRIQKRLNRTPKSNSASQDANS